jgi:hypothetical protein
MRKFTIPKEDWKAVIDLFLLEPEKKRAFLETIKDPSNVSHAKDFAKHFEAITNKEHKETENIIDVLFKLYNLYDSSGEDINTNVTAILNAISDIDKKDIKEASATDFELFSSFIKELLSLHDTFGVRAKVYRVMPQQQHIFRRSEIYSDIRAIFRPGKPEIKPSAAVIIHSLKIVYYENYETKNFFLGLSDNDLHQLKRTIDRAVKKHECLKGMITDNLAIQYLEEEKN